jgi:uncharacterized membrane protein
MSSSETQMSESDARPGFLKNLTRFFIRGVFTLLPAGLTVVLLISFFRWIDQYAKGLFSVFGSDFYFPGMGLVLGVVVICTLGYLTTLPFMTKIFVAAELPFKNVPIIKSVYSAIKSLSDYFSPDGGKADQQVVVVRVPGLDAEVVGLVTRRHLNDLAPEFTKEDRIAVYIPLSYQVGGLTVFVPRSWVKRTNMRVEVAMRSALTAWMPDSVKSQSDL